MGSVVLRKSSGTLHRESAGRLFSSPVCCKFTGGWSLPHSAACWKALELCPSQTPPLLRCAWPECLWRVRLESEDVKLSHHRQKQEPNRWAEKQIYLCVLKWDELIKLIHPKSFSNITFYGLVSFIQPTFCFPPPEKNNCNMRQICFHITVIKIIITWKLGTI